HLPWTLPRELLESEGDHTRHAAAVQVDASHCGPRLPARAPDHGAGAVELVPAVRPQPADVCGKHLLDEARGLQEGEATRVPRAGTGELRGAAAGPVEQAFTIAMGLRRL